MKKTLIRNFSTFNAALKYLEQVEREENIENAFIFINKRKIEVRVKVINSSIYLKK